VRLPPDAIGEGVQTFVLSDTATSERLASFSLVAGDALAHDLRAEIDLLKRAFRRHCAETGGGGKEGWGTMPGPPDPPATGPRVEVRDGLRAGGG
jgi:hypothetical protein